MIDNPIMKFNEAVRRTNYVDGKAEVREIRPAGKWGNKRNRRWGYKCPLCGYIGFYASTRNSRKCAKDALAKHKKQEHGGPR